MNWSRHIPVFSVPKILHSTKEYINNVEQIMKNISPQEKQSQEHGVVSIGLARGYVFYIIYVCSYTNTNRMIR